MINVDGETRQEMMNVPQVLNMLESKIGRVVSKEENLSDLGMSSLDFVSFIVSIEEKFGVEIPMEYLALEKIGTIENLALLFQSIGQSC